VTKIEVLIRFFDKTDCELERIVIRLYSAVWLLYLFLMKFIFLPFHWISSCIISEILVCPLISCDF
jgi:hypothetical protein